MTNNNSKFKNVKLTIKKLLAGILIGGSLLGLTNTVEANSNNEVEKFIPSISIKEDSKPPVNLPEIIIHPEGIFNKRIEYLSSYINSEIFECTAYCEAGISANGTDISGGAWYYVAVDPYVIPLGSTLYIEFFEEYVEYSGYYLAVDTGGAVCGNTIDIFVGDGAYDIANHFGRRTCRVTLIN